LSLFGYIPNRIGSSQRIAAIFLWGEEKKKERKKEEDTRAIIFKGTLRNFNSI